MRLVKSLLVAAVIATASLATAGAAQAAELTNLLFVDTFGASDFETGGTNVRVSYRCTSRTRIGEIVVQNLDSGFARLASARCDGVPRSVLLRTDPGRNGIVLTQRTKAFAKFVVFGAPCPTAEC